MLTARSSPPGWLAFEEARAKLLSTESAETTLGSDGEIAIDADEVVAALFQASEGAARGAAVVEAGLALFRELAMRGLRLGLTLEHGLRVSGETAREVVAGLVCHAALVAQPSGHGRR